MNDYKVVIYLNKNDTLVFEGTTDITLGFTGDKIPETYIQFSRGKANFTFFSRNILGYSVSKYK